MEFILVILAVMLAALLGWLLKHSFNVQPWVAEPVDETANQAPLGANPKLIGLTTLLAVVTSFFALIMSAYGLRMDYGDWVPLTEPGLLWLNTGMLVLASIAFQWTRNGAVSGRVWRLMPGLLAAGLFGRQIIERADDTAAAGFFVKVGFQIFGDTEVSQVAVAFFIQ